MMRRLILSACLLLSPAAFATSWDSAAFRTDSGLLVQRGMRMTEVLRDAGKPLERRVLSRGVNAGPAAAGETKEVWTYRGADGFYDITFVGDRVTGIVVSPDR
ncbi:hypothetical protein SVA_3611 [Sulfurifustis variabilis]|uniref:Lipoprotein n=1 Tax=Sulfurifustis variabilis TaxID=1675686 RepID=A0A1B4VGY1_9GAMM|nr:DUF2845 domain-containing protein [Sulfurifustis variabilis]BAU50147.1 hypothetical protein SVA_3611 [Sulfurifustis variabilis]